MKEMKKRIISVRIEADIEVGEDFDIQSIAIGKYVEDSVADAEFILMKDDDFRVVDYHKISEISEDGVE